MARSTYYYHISHTNDTDKYADIRKRIVDIFEEHHKRYGYRRVHMQLVNEGHVINHKTIQKLMSEMHLKSKVRKVKYKSYKGESVGLPLIYLIATSKPKSHIRNGLQMLPSLK